MGTHVVMREWAAGQWKLEYGPTSYANATGYRHRAASRQLHVWTVAKWRDWRAGLRAGRSRRRRSEFEPRSIFTPFPGTSKRRRRVGYHSHPAHPYSHPIATKHRRPR